MPSLRSALVITVTAAAAVAVPMGAAAAAAQPAPAPAEQQVPLAAAPALVPAQAALGAAYIATAYGVGPLKHLTLDPLANSGSDPLDNAVGSQVADFRPVSTAAVTGPVAQGGTLSTLPLVGIAAAFIPG